MGLRVISDNGRNLRIVPQRQINDGTVSEIVFGDNRSTLSKLRLDAISEIENDSLWAELRAAKVFHLTILKNDVPINTARFENAVLQDVLEKMDAVCGLSKEAPDDKAVEASLDLNPETIQLVNFAAYIILGENRQISQVPRSLTEAGRDRISSALQIRGAAPSRVLNEDRLMTLLEPLGVSITPRFANVTDFQDGRAMAQSTSGRWGMIDTKGTWTITPVFEDAQNIGSGKFAVKSAGLWRVIDSSGERLRRVLSDTVPVCNDAYCSFVNRGEVRLVRTTDLELIRTPKAKVTVLPGDTVLIKAGGVWQRMGPDGSTAVTPLRSQTIKPGPKGFVLSQTAPGGPWSLIRLADFKPVGAQFAEIAPTGQRLLGVRSDDRWGFIETRNGTETIAQQFFAVGPFGRGLAPATPDDRLWGYINRRGSLEIAPRFTRAAPFSQGRAAVTLRSGKATFVDSKGDILLPPAFDQTRSFSNGKAAFRIGEKWGFVGR